MTKSNTAAISTAEARDRLSELVNRAAYGKERVLLSRRGKPVAAVVSLDDVATLQRLEDQRDVADARAARAEAKRRGTTTLNEALREHGIRRPRRR
ncbi:MAG: type II toxin-antitoxin system Phd/YefM family antitoxin [Alphaproteobacteria bacterium]|nr:type II toxin-antitoxin system Phd/YefM family antitoxin [Alphaproteobacteria bacterium]